MTRINALLKKLPRGRKKQGPRGLVGATTVSKRRILVRRVVAVLAVLMVLAALLVGVAYTPLFSVDGFRAQGTARVSPPELAKIAGLRTGQAVATVDEEKAQRRLERQAWIQDAKVESGLGGTVTIRVVERPAVLVVATQDGRFAGIGDNGRVVDLAATPRSGLPVLVSNPVAPVVGTPLDAQTAPLAAVAKALPPSLRGRVTQLDSSERGLRLGTSDGIIVILGSPEDISNKLTSAATVLRTADPATVGTLDVTVPALPVAAPKTVSTAKRPN